MTMPPVFLSEATLFRVLVSLVAAELRQLRQLDSQQLDAAGWTPATSLVKVSATTDAQAGEASLNADSFEFVALATAVNNFFNLHESGLEDYLLRYRTLGEWVSLVRTARGEGIRDIAFSTSGSTGDASLCNHRWHDLMEEVRAFSRQFQELLESSPRRVVALAPCHHIYGFLFTALLPEYLDVPVIHGEPALAAALAHRLEPGDLVVGFPFIWQQVARCGARFPEGVLGLTSTGPCDASIIHRLQDQGLAHMVEVYGSTETAGIGFRVDPIEPFVLLPRWRRGPDEISLLDTDNNQVYPLGDQVEWHGPRHLSPQGRLDLAVQVGGVNVYPQRIARELETLPFVGRARVRPMPLKDGGRLKAFIVPAPDAPDPDEIVARLRDWCAAQLSGPETPRAFTLGSRLPTNPMGKPADWQVDPE